MPLSLIISQLYQNNPPYPGNPIDVNGKEEMEVHNTIAELMILANSTIARIISYNTPLDALVRIHPPPSATKLKAVKELSSETGIPLFQDTSNEELRKQLRTFREKILFPKLKQNKKSAALVKSDRNVTKTTKAGKSNSLLPDANDTDSSNSIHSKNQLVADFVTSVVVKSMSEARYVCFGTLSGDIFAGMYYFMFMCICQTHMYVGEYLYALTIYMYFVHKY